MPLQAMRTNNSRGEGGVGPGLAPVAVRPAPGTSIPRNNRGGAGRGHYDPPDAAQLRTMT
jgi:hypothetical protein